MSEPTEQIHKGRRLFEPGQSGNPAGRPKGSRNKLGEAFIEALHDDFKAHGPSTIQKVREEKPDQYLKVIAAVVPKELHIKDSAFSDLSDDELNTFLAVVRSTLTGESPDDAGAGGGSAEEGAAVVPTVPGHGTA